MIAQSTLEELGVVTLPTPIGENCKASALALAEAGYPVFPLCERDKKPRVAGGFKAASTAATQIDAWWEQWPSANVGLRTGKASGLVVIDIDPQNGGALAALEALGALPATYTVATGGGGLHLYFQYREGVTNSPGNLPRGIDVRGEGGYVVAPPSLHVSGTRYSVQKNAPVAPLPECLYEVLRPSQHATGVKDASPTAKLVEQARQKVRQGEYRNDTGFWLCCQLRDNGMSQEDAQPLLLDYQTHVEHSKSPPYTAEEAHATLLSVYSRAPREPSATPQGGSTEGRGAVPTELRSTALQEDSFNDVGNAARFAAANQRRLKHVSGWGWLAYDGQRWVRQAEKQAQELAKADAQAFLAQAGACEDRRLRDAALDWAKRSLSRRGIGATLDLAASDPRLSAAIDEFDSSPALLNVANGTLDLRTGVLSPHSAGDMLTHLAPVTYDPTKQADRFIHFLDEVFAGDSELITFVQTALGYSLTGLTREHVYFLCYGAGRNGKSTLLETVAVVLGDYAKPLKAEALLRKRFSGATADPELAHLVGARFVTVQEVPDGELDTAKVKGLTGGDALQVRGLYTSPRTLRPTFTLWLCANARPKVEETTDALWERVRLIPFTVSFKSSPDRRLRETLAAEAAGILNWLVAGAVRYFATGLPRSEAVTQATADYRTEEDPASLFFTECLVPDVGATVTLADALDAYTHWRVGTPDAPCMYDVKGLAKLAREHGVGMVRHKEGKRLTRVRLVPPAGGVRGVRAEVNSLIRADSEDLLNDVHHVHPAEEGDAW